MNNHVAEFGSIMHRTLRSVWGITMGVLILMAMAAPSARAALLTYYDFEDGNLASDPPGLQNTSIGNTFGTFTFPANTGTAVNEVTPFTTNTALTIRSVPEDGSGGFNLGNLTTTGLTDVHLSFALLSAATGGSFTNLTLEYSILGGAQFIPFAGVAMLTTHTDYNPALTFDVSALTGGAVDGVSGLFFTFVFTGATDSDAATFIDNIQVTAVPEPSSYIGALFGLVGLCWFQRRWLMTRLLSLRSA